MKTYKEIIEGKELVVTDSLIVAKFFEIEHRNVRRTITNIKKRLEKKKEDCSLVSSPLFEESSYINEQNRKQPKVIMDEKAFVTYIANASSSSKLGAERLFNIKQDFINEFFRLRDQNSKLANLGRIFIEYFAPIDEIGMLSIFNGKLRLFTRRACLTTEKNARPFPVEDQKALIDGMSMVELRDISAKTIVRHAKNKKATNAKRYVPSFLYKYFDEKGWLTNKVPYNPTLNLF